MQGTIAQIVALTCHGNAAIRGIEVPQFFPSNSTCQFCEYVKFIAGGRSEAGGSQVVTFAESPDQWIQGLRNRGILGLRLLQRAQNQPQISDRHSSAFVGGGRQWTVEALRQGFTSEFWLSKWEVGDRKAPDRRIWRVTYGLSEVANTVPLSLRTLEEIIADLRATLIDIRAFAAASDCPEFASVFATALRALDEPQADIGYHKDLFPPGALTDAAQSMLKAAMSAWVFGGMGSWNDMGFSGEPQAEYSRLSDSLFNLLNEAIEAAATSSMSPAS